jgi:hypothetical protein
METICTAKRYGAVDEESLVPKYCMSKPAACL